MADVGVKICGLSNRVMIDAALDAGANMIGLVIFPKSPRHVDLMTAADLVTDAIESVVLLVDPDDDLVRAVASKVRPNWIQLHGHESVARVAEIRGMIEIPLIKAFGVGTAADLALAAPYTDIIDLPLFDTKPPRGSVLPGGNGVAFDWSLLNTWPDRRFMLSGGLTPTSVADAIRSARPALVDVSSGVESAPGIKDPDLMRAFVKAVKAA